MGRAGVAGIAELVRMPVDVVERMLPRLVEDGRVQLAGSRLLAPNFIDAQETPQTDAARKRASRERASARCKSDGSQLFLRPPPPPDPPKKDENVTNGHAASRPVTPCLTVPSLAVPESALTRAREADPPELETSPEVAAIAAELERHAQLRPIATRDVAEVLEGRRMASGKPLEAILAAIGELAADAVPGWSEETLRRKVRAYCDRAGPRPSATSPPPAPVVVREPDSIAWRVWREAYEARYGAAYVGSGPDGPAMQAIVADARAAVEERRKSDPRPSFELLEILLRHWFAGYLRDDGWSGFSLVEKRHGLGWFRRKDIPKYGSPWAKARSSAPARASPPAIVLPERERARLSARELVESGEALVQAPDVSGSRARARAGG
jgi:hypothetical protein